MLNYLLQVQVQGYFPVQEVFIFNQNVKISLRSVQSSREFVRFVNSIMINYTFHMKRPRRLHFQLAQNSLWLSFDSSI